jgi:hypothetical protein
MELRRFSTFGREDAQGRTQDERAEGRLQSQELPVIGRPADCQRQRDEVDQAEHRLPNISL